MLATSNIAEGSAIEVGLGVVVKNGNIYFSKKGMIWPGTAAVVVAVVCFIKGLWRGECDADGCECARIGPRLEPASESAWVPKQLEKAPFSFEGVNNSKGLAFVIKTDSPWFDQLKIEPDSLLRPYITGDDITSSALNQITRWALDIGDRTLEEIAIRWPVAYRFIIEEVQPTRTVRALNSYKGLFDRWWQFWNPRTDLMRRIRQREKFIGYSKNTKYPVGMLAPSDWIYTNKVLLIGLERDDLYAISLSTGFRTWLEKFSGGNLGETLSLSISESVAKYPVPENKVSQAGINAAARFNDFAVQCCAEHDIGLTDVLNWMNAPSNSDPIIKELRNLLGLIDDEVVATYGWSDVEVNYDFRGFSGGSINDQWRWALSNQTTIELMRRLVEINRTNYHVISLAEAEPSANRTRGSKVASASLPNDLFTGNN